MNELSITTWNINSVRKRIDLVKRFTDSHAPTILCLQETKVDDPLFPLSELQALGYPHIAFAGQKSYNGVAILSRLPFADTQRMDVLGNGDARHIAVTLENGVVLHNFYIPAGGDEPDPEANPKFADKLAFLRTLTQWSAGLPADQPTIAVGDFNIAPLEHDVWSHKQLLKVVSHTPVEIDHLDAFKAAANWTDTARHFTPETEKLYSWWSYRNRDWKSSNRGRRLDHLWVTPPLRDALRSVTTFTQARDWESPSDHVPVTLSLGGMQP